jgi:hypothetical protein
MRHLTRRNEQLDGPMTDRPADRVLIATFAGRISRLGDVSQERFGEFVATAQDQAPDRVMPASGSVRAMLGEQLLHSASGWPAI